MSMFIPGFLIFMNSCKKIENKVGRNQYANGGKGEGKARFPNGYSQRKSLSTRVHSPFLARLIAQYDGWQMTQGNTLLTPPRTRWKRNTLRVVNGWNRKPGLVRAQGEEKTPLRPPYLCVHLFPPRESFVKFGLKGARSQYPLNPSSVASRRRSPRRRKQFNGRMVKGVFCFVLVVAFTALSTALPFDPAPRFVCAPPWTLLSTGCYR